MAKMKRIKQKKIKNKKDRKMSLQQSLRKRQRKKKM